MTMWVYEEQSCLPQHYLFLYKYTTLSPSTACPICVFLLPQCILLLFPITTAPSKYGTAMSENVSSCSLLGRLVVAVSQRRRDCPAASLAARRRLLLLECQWERVVLDFFLCICQYVMSHQSHHFQRITYLLGQFPCNVIFCREPFTTLLQRSEIAWSHHTRLLTG